MVDQFGSNTVLAAWSLPGGLSPTRTLRRFWGNFRVGGHTGRNRSMSESAICTIESANQPEGPRESQQGYPGVFTDHELCSATPPVQNTGND
jgi:hypothetical protein